MNADQMKVIVTIQHMVAVQAIALEELMRLLPPAQHAALASALQTRTNEYLTRMGDVMTPDGDRMVTMQLQSLLESIGHAAPPPDDAKR